MVDFAVNTGADCRCSELTAVAGESERCLTFHAAHLFASKSLFSYDDRETTVIGWFLLRSCKCIRIVLLLTSVCPSVKCVNCDKTK